MTDSVRLQWIYSMHKCARVHNAMTTITNSEHRTSEQHVDLGTSRSYRDFIDLGKIQEWFDHHEPFNVNEHKLQSLSSGLTAADGDIINCHNTEEVGRKIQKHLDNIKILEASIKKSELVKSLDHLYPRIEVDKEKVQINPTLLFSCLIAIVQREEDMIPYFAYELTAFLTSLFKHYAMRKTAKAQLAKVLISNMQPVSSSKASLDPQKLPPTERAAHDHSLRVHLQVMIWKKLSNNNLDPKQWGWKLEGSVFAPIMTDLAEAPDS